MQFIVLFFKLILSPDVSLLINLRAWYKELGGPIQERTASGTPSNSLNRNFLVQCATYI